MHVIAIVVDPSKPRVVYAALDAGGVCKSNDGGASWTRASQTPAATTPAVTRSLPQHRRGPVVDPT